jgi:elongation factor 1-gamma
MSTSLYVDSGNAAAFKILIAAEYTGMSINVPEFKASDASTPDFLAKSPMGRVPVLETPAGCITQSNAIARYVAGSNKTIGLTGATYFDSAKVDAWMDFCTHEIETNACVWYFPAFGYMPVNADASAVAKKNLAAALAVLDAHLADKTYLVGEAVTMADIAVASALVYPFKFVADVSYRKPFGNVMRWFDLCVHQPQFQAVIGDVVLAKTELTAGAAPIATTGKASKDNKKDKAPKEKKEKAPKQEKKKEEKKKEKPQEEEEEKPKPKPVHPFKTMDNEKPSTFVMDTWKKTYSNCSTYEEGMSSFWETFDDKGWSIFRGDYQYNEENKQLFMTSNLIAGFIQRTEEIRKWLFGTMTIRGEEGKGMKITCYYLIRGDSIQPLIDANDDAAYYTWTKVSTPASDADKKLLMDYWCSEGPLEGEACLDSRVYK